jgi:hypothetical protein
MVVVSVNELEFKRARKSLNKNTRHVSSKLVLDDSEGSLVGVGACHSAGELQGTVIGLMFLLQIHGRRRQHVRIKRGELVRTVVIIAGNHPQSLRRYCITRNEGVMGTSIIAHQFYE